jgi:hypothetical protein
LPASCYTGAQSATVVGHASAVLAKAEAASTMNFIGSVGPTMILPTPTTSQTSRGYEDPANGDPTARPQAITVVVSRTSALNDVALSIHLSDIAPPEPNVSFIPYGPDLIQFEPADEDDIEYMPDSVFIPANEMDLLDLALINGCG